VRTKQPLLILVAGPYRSGTNDDPNLIAPADNRAQRLLTTAPSQEALRSYFSEEAVAHVYDQLALCHAVLGEKEAARAVCLRLLTEARTRQLLLGAHAVGG
jgi:hypothetical protein